MRDEPGMAARCAGIERGMEAEAGTVGAAHCVPVPRPAGSQVLRAPADGCAAVQLPHTRDGRESQVGEPAAEACRGWTEHCRAPSLLDSLPHAVSAGERQSAMYRSACARWGGAPADYMCARAVRRAPPASPRPHRQAARILTVTLPAGLAGRRPGAGRHGAATASSCS